MNKSMKKNSEVFEQLDIRNYIKNGLFREVDFREAVRAENWEQYRGRRVLIRNCSRGVIVPPWAFMVLTAHLVPVARAVLYGDECAPVAVYKDKRA